MRTVWEQRYKLGLCTFDVDDPGSFGSGRGSARWRISLNTSLTVWVVDALHLSVECKTWCITMTRCCDQIYNMKLFQCQLKINRKPGLQARAQAWTYLELSLEPTWALPQGLAWLGLSQLGWARLTAWSQALHNTTHGMQSMSDVAHVLTFSLSDWMTNTSHATSFTASTRLATLLIRTPECGLLNHLLQWIMHRTLQWFMFMPFFVQLISFLSMVRHHFPC
jgi:hypothetical protein